LDKIVDEESIYKGARTHIKVKFKIVNTRSADGRGEDANIWEEVFHLDVAHET